MNRKQFLRTSLVAGGAAVIGRAALAAPTTFSAEQIDEFVGAAHNDVDETRKIVEKYPLILNCTSQRARGDFETALGGASHMGRRDIADLLVAKGARSDIFNLAFLGHDDFVKSLVKASPQYLTSYGPHGFTLLHHAKVGKRDDLADWLQEQGLKETHFKVFSK